MSRSLPAPPVQRPVSREIERQENRRRQVVVCRLLHDRGVIREALQHSDLFFNSNSLSVDGEWRGQGHGLSRQLAASVLQWHRSHGVN